MNEQALAGWRSFRQKFGKVADSFLVVLSAIAVATFTFDQILTGHTNFVFFGVQWAQFQYWLQITIWAIFVFVFVLMGSTSHRKWPNYCRKWWLESIILITWAPFPHDGSVIRLIVLLGSIAHIVRFARWTRDTFSQNALIVIGVATWAMVVIATALLMVVEKETYKSFEETAFTVFMTAMTMGPSIPPVTAAGRAVFYFISASGVTIVAIFVGVMREYIQRFFGHFDFSREILAKVNEIKALIEDLLSHIINGFSEEVREQLKSQRGTIRRLEGQLIRRDRTIAVLEGVVATQGETIAQLRADRAASKQPNATTGGTTDPST